MPHYFSRLANQFTLPQTTNKYRFYGMRIGLLIIVALALLLILSGFAVQGVITQSQLSNWWVIIFVFISAAVFSQTLGFWRKVVCVTGSIFVYIFLNLVLLNFFIFALPSFSQIYFLLDASLFVASVYFLFRWMRRWKDALKPTL